jgi:hypothetical protein
MAGYIWLIDDSLHFYFVAYDALDAPLDLDGLTTATAPFADLSVTKESPDYRNSMIMKGGKAETSTQTEYFVGDGEKSSFELRYPVKRVVSVVKHGATQTVGEQDTGVVCQWYFSIDSKTLSQASDETKLPEFGILEVIYIGQYDLIVKVSDREAIAALKAIDGGSGIVELVVDAPDFTSESALIAYGKALLAKYAKQVTNIEYGTEYQYLRPGHMQHISLPALSVHDDFLVTQVAYSHEDNHDVWRASVTNGPISDLWEKVFGKKPRAADTQPSSITSVEDFTVEWLYTAYPSPFRPDCDPVELFKYLELDVSGGYRIPITDISISDDLVIVTASVLDVEAVGEIAKVSLWGGHGCSNAIGSGEKNWEEDFVADKSEYEAFQFTISNVKHNWPVFAALGGETCGGVCGAGLTSNDAILGVI